MTCHTEFIPRGRPAAALLSLDEDGAQFTTDLAKKLGIYRDDLRSVMKASIQHGLVNTEHRKIGAKRHALWYLTPDGARVAEVLRSMTGAA